MGNEKDEFQIAFMPWLDISEEVSMGPFTFWPYSKMAKERIKDEALRNHLDRVFKSYVNHDGRPVNTITVCSLKGDVFWNSRKGKHDDLYAAVNALAFSSICQATINTIINGDTGGGVPNTEKFRLLIFTFVPGCDSISVRSGNMWSGGWKIGQITFQKPWHLRDGFGCYPTELLDDFGKIFDFDSGPRERIFRSLEWFAFAHSEGDAASSLSKIVMMATAFEILLKFPNRNQKKKFFASEIEKRLGSPKLLKVNFPADGEELTQTKMARWAWEFYDLRNKIVHGAQFKDQWMNYIVEGYRRRSQLMVADVVFWECVKHELYSNHVIGNELRQALTLFEKQCQNQTNAGSDSSLFQVVLGFDIKELHQALGWEPED